MKVMLVEDEKITRITLGDVLVKEGFEVISCANGRDALARMDETVDIVISDLRMPGMDGLELLRCIKQKSATVEVILMTAYSTVANAVEALKLGRLRLSDQAVCDHRDAADPGAHPGHRRLVTENIRLRDRSVTKVSVGLVGASTPMAEARPIPSMPWRPANTPS